jgi:hypothetical protein
MMREPYPIAAVIIADAETILRRRNPRNKEFTMKKLMMISMLAVAVASAPAIAQTAAPKTTTGTERSQADCQTNWKSADRNNDGRLDKAEISAAKSVVPTTLASRTTISQADFMRACGVTVQGQKK